MERFTKYLLSLLLLACSIGADAGIDSSVDEHRVPRVSGRIVKVYSGSRPEPYMCTSEGYKSDPNNCASFYRCVKERNGKLNVFRYQCAPGTVYDPDLETCNHPRSTRRTECGGMVKPTETIDFSLPNQIDSQNELPRPITTNQLAFVKETTLEPTTWVASQSKSTKSPQKTTLFQTQSSSAAYADTSRYNSEYNNYVMSTNQPWISKTEQNYWSSTTPISEASPKQKNDDICSDDGFTGDAENCRKFYRCVGNQRGGFLKYEFFCSESTVWDEAIQSCNHPWAVKRSKCGRSMPFTDKSETDTGTIKIEKSTTQEPRSSSAEYGQKISKIIQQQLQISHGSKVTQTQTQISHSDQVTQNQTQINYGDRITKNKDTAQRAQQNQTQIANGSAVSQTQTQIDYGNKGMQTQLQIDHSKDSSQSQTQVHDSTTSHTTTSKQDYNQSNNNECSESGFMGDSNDCKKFYRCVDSGRGTFTKFEYVCGEGTVWDQSIEACNHAWAVKDCGSQSHSPTQSSNVHSTTSYADTTTTTQSYSEAPEPDIDYNDVGYGNQGKPETTTFVSTTSSKTTTSKEPQYDTTKKPQTEPNNDNECKSNGFMGDSDSCKKFYRCVDNGRGGYTRHEFTCGEGTVWDSTIEACNHAWAVEKCGSGGSTESSQTPEQTTSEISGESTIASTTTQIDKNTEEAIIHTTVSSSTSTSTSSESNDSNTCRNSGFMGDNKNCKKFYRCVDNGDGSYTRYEFTCGEGTVWDSKIEACNHEWAVETCGGNSESTTLTHSSTSQHPTLQEEDNVNEPTTTQRQESSSTTQSSSTNVSNNISTSDQACTGNGFVGDKNNCKKFYRCVENRNGGYDRYEFTCGEGTVWDESILACNHAWAVKECDANGSGIPQSSNESTSGSTVSSTETGIKEDTSPITTENTKSTTGNPAENEINDGDCESEGFFGSISDCKKFIRCVDDGKGGFIKYEFSCGEGTTWNQHIQACDHPSPDRPCGQDYQSTTKETHINDEMATETATKITSTTSSSDKEESEVTQKPQSSSKTCETAGFNGDPSDCKKFYRCVEDGKGGYTKYDFSCGDGTVWNQEILACDHESDDNSCLGSGGKPTDSSTSHSQITTSGSQSESTTSASTTAKGQETDKTDSPTSSTSSDKCKSDGFFAHPHDCKKFIRCVSNGNGEYTRYEFSCGEGTIWVQEIQACDHDTEENSCSKQSESTTKQQEHGSSSTTDFSYSSSTESQTQNNKEDDEYPQPTTQAPSNSNSDECKSEGYFANKNDCRKFYRCVDNGDRGYTKYDFVCGEGTAWDSKIGNCNHINEVASCAENDNQEIHTQQTMKEEEISQTTEGTSSTTQSTSSSSSEHTEGSESGSETGSNDKCESEGYFGDSKDCKKFYRCVDDGKGGLTKYDFTCGEGTIWDQDITNCNHPQDVTNPSCKPGEEGSEGESQTSSTSSTTTSPESTTSGSSDNSTQSSSNCTQESSEKPASSKDISCEEAGYYPNPNDCKKFYRCVDWDGDGKRFSVYHFECGEGTIWDPALDTCNHEESVYPPRDCSQTQAQNESSSEGTTTTKQEETTTQDSSTSEQTTTQESTTSEQTTTEQEQTTTQQTTTSEPTTTQQSTASEQTTTQQSTTSEETTTQQSTTSEQTTTQQSTTSEKTTTLQTTTSELTTTEQSTTSEQTTSQQSTTSEQSTTQESTSEQTTQESTTSEQTTQQSTTSEQTTEQSTTSEQTTEQSTTSEQTTTEATEENGETTESSTTEGTTESSTTESSTTEAESGSTTEQSGTTEGEQESTTQSSSSEKECPETEDDQNLFVCPTSFKRHPKYCNMFYQCTEDDDTHEVKIATFKCPNDTIYDESQTQCIEENKADKKCNGEMARRHRFKRLHRDSKEPITVDKENKSCSSVGYHTFEKNIECSKGFLKCERNKAGKIRGYVYQCPEGYLFWAISKRCELAVKIRDCNRSSNDWTGRWNIPVDRKNVAF